MIKRLMHIHLFALLIGLGPVVSADGLTAPEDDGIARADSVSVVELFTSQSCNSCPPADALAADLALRPGVLVLSWNVDYWDSLGWKDTIARPENTARQFAYNRALGRGNRVFTPQMVIGGRDQAVGSNRLDVETALAERSNRAAVIPLRYGEDTVTLLLPEQDGVENAIVSIIHYAFAKVVQVGAGENGGRALTYTHPVMENHEVAVWDGSAMEVVIDKEQFCDKGNAVLIQQGNAGPILMAAVVDIER